MTGVIYAVSALGLMGKAHIKISYDYYYYSSCFLFNLINFAENSQNGRTPTT